MKLPTAFRVIFAVSAIVLYAADAFAGVKISLKNGRDITAESCTETADAYHCAKAGGIFIIEKSDVADIRDITAGGTGHYGELVKEDTPAEQAGNSPGRSGETQGRQGRLEEIRQRKQELVTEREKLVSEREKLSEDVRNAPTWMPVKRFNELQSRSNEMDKKIQGFNEEVRRLTQEEGELRDNPGNTADRTLPSENQAR